MYFPSVDIWNIKGIYVEISDCVNNPLSKCIVSHNWLDIRKLPSFSKYGYFDWTFIRSVWIIEKESWNITWHLKHATNSLSAIIIWM